MSRPQAVAVVDAGSRELDNYDPAQGLKTIAVAEAAEKMFARAKDGAGLHEAVEQKLGEQRRFVLWFDEVKLKGRPPEEKHNGTVILSNLGVDHMTLSRWRKKLADPRKFDVALEQANERCLKICEQAKGQGESYRVQFTGENEWYTPPEYLAAARDVLGEIDLDPASSEAAQAKVRAVRHFTIADNGLEQEWHGRVWLNPPYAQPLIGQFASKMTAERRSGRVSAAIMLTNNSTDTEWFRELGTTADAICFTRGRIRFYDIKGELSSPVQGQAFHYFGDDREGFAARFNAVGLIVFPWHGEIE